MRTATTAAVVLAGFLFPAAGPAGAQTAGGEPPRLANGNPDLNGIWQALNTAHYDVEPHVARPALQLRQGPHGPLPDVPVLRLGAVGAVPGGMGVIAGGGRIPYTPEARALKEENRAHWVDRDPEVKCYMPGIPRATYMPYPFQIVQTEEYILFAYEFASASRVVYMNRPDFMAPVDAWMGHSLGSWDGETLVIDVTAQVPDTWLDMNGNHHSNSIRVVERYTATSPHHLQYEATIEDPEVYTRPWTLSLPLYRRVDENMQLLEFKCVEFAEELMYGHLRKDPDLTPTYRPSGYGSAYEGEAPGPR